MGSQVLQGISFLLSFSGSICCKADAAQQTHVTALVHRSVYKWQKERGTSLISLIKPLEWVVADDCIVNNSNWSGARC